MNSFQEGENDRGAINPSNDLLHGIGGPMIRSKTKRMKQAMQGLILKIKEKEYQCELRLAPKWITFLQIDEDALRPIYKTRSTHELS